MAAGKRELTLKSFQIELSKARRKGIALEFIKGPVPKAWISKCAKLGRKCVNVGIALWWSHGMEGSPVVLTRRKRADFAVSRSSLSRALAAMEKAGLVEVERHTGRAPRVRMLWDGIDEQKESG